MFAFVAAITGKADIGNIICAALVDRDDVRYPTPKGGGLQLWRD